MSDDLLPCPLCNSRVGYRRYNQIHHPYHPECPLSDALTYNVNLWNTRHPQQDAQGLVDDINGIIMALEMAKLCDGVNVKIDVVLESLEAALKSYQEGGG